MSKNETNSNSNHKWNELMERARTSPVEPSVYLKTRVLAHLNEQPETTWLQSAWKWISVGSLGTAAFLGFMLFNTMKKVDSLVQAHQAYVIHVDFNQTDLTQVAQAEVVLPDGVQFSSSNDLIKQKRSLKMPVNIKSIGRGKLPFVVTAQDEGEKEIIVRLLDGNNQIVRDQVLKIKFAKGESQSGTL